MSDGYEPHGHFTLLGPDADVGTAVVVGEGVPGVGMGTGWVPGRAIPVPQIPVPGPIFSHILVIRPYPRPNEGNFMYI